MKKLIFVLCLLCFVGGVSVVDAQSYDLQESLKNVGVQPEEHPAYLPGANPDADSFFSKIRVGKWMGKPYIVTYYIQRIINALTGLAAAMAVLFIIQNSFNLLTSAGGSEQVTKSKKGLMWSLIGLVLIIGSYIIVKTVISLPYAGGEVDYSIQKMTPIPGTLPTNANPKQLDPMKTNP